MINDDLFDPIYLAAVESVEEAIVNAMVAARKMGGTKHDITTVSAIDHNELVSVMGRYHRLKG